MNHLISMRDLNEKQIMAYMHLAEKIENGKVSINLQGKLMAALFYEPSTRTRMSFETAMKRLSGEVISMVGTAGTSVQKGETLADTAKIMARYTDVIVIRHPNEGAARWVSEVVDVPVINAGDGSNQHPTQSLLDLYSIMKTQGTLRDLNITLVGDLKYGRTVHSLVQAMSPFNPTFTFVSPPSLAMPDDILRELSDKNISFANTEDLNSSASSADIMYVTRIQRERFPDPEEYDKVKNLFIVNNSVLENAKDNLKVLHPLPRVNEIAVEVDSTPYAYYFEQAENGVIIRQAILAKHLGVAE
jgi:aspartate carbamoyltransferase catalytic subunit